MSIDFTNYFVVLCRVSWIFWILFLAKPLAGTLHKTLYISRWGRINPRCHFHYIVNKPLISSLYRLSSFSRLLLLSAIRYPSIFSFDKIHKNPSSKWFTIFLNFFLTDLYLLPSYFSDNPLLNLSSENICSYQQYFSDLTYITPYAKAQYTFHQRHKIIYLTFIFDYDTFYV